MSIGTYDFHKGLIAINPHYFQVVISETITNWAIYIARLHKFYIYQAFEYFQFLFPKNSITYFNLRQLHQDLGKATILDS
ncbi:MAG: hypothetical protein MGF17_00405 [Trichodesmium sp. MAG_R04]|nr:hypothetical protein [Trichodesmium sp. MAG_R04]